MEASLHSIEAETERLAIQDLAESRWDQNFVKQKLESTIDTSSESIVLETDTESIHDTLEASTEETRAGGDKNGHVIESTLDKRLALLESHTERMIDREGPPRIFRSGR